MKKTFYLCITIALVISFTLSSNVYAVDGTRKTIIGKHNFTLSATNLLRNAPVYQTQKTHVKGTQTIIRTIDDYHTKIEASERWYFHPYDDMGYSLKIAPFSQTGYVSRGITYTIPASTASGKYRIATVFVGSRLILNEYDAEGIIYYRHIVDYTPDLDNNYTALKRYSN